MKVVLLLRIDPSAADVTPSNVIVPGRELTLRAAIHVEIAEAPGLDGDGARMHQYFVSYRGFGV